jgi:hypothetical protein
MDDGAIDRSEQIYKAFMAATGRSSGVVQGLGDLDWPPFKDLKKELEGSMPLDPEMIMPRARSEAGQLEGILRCGID